MQTTKDQRPVIVVTGLLLILAAFMRAYQVSHDLTWFYDLDVARDMSYVQQTLYGRFGRDPNYAGHFLWYNPLMSLLQAAVIRITGLPINIVMVRLGAYANLLAPLAFFAMMLRLFDFRIALAGLCSFLFFASGVIPGFYAATYSPWMYSGCFMQFIFYVNIALCYQAFNTQRLGWWLLLGAGVGVGFLGHTAPTVLIILLLALMQGKLFWKAIRQKNTEQLKRLLFQSVAVFLPFVIISLPFLYYIIGKYHMHFENRKPFEYVDTIFIWRNYRLMFSENFSVSLLIALFGFGWFYKKYREPLLRSILLNWGAIAIVMFFYATLVGSLDEHTSIRLPGTVPSFHYFFYLKALQSVFFGVGMFALVNPLLTWLVSKTGHSVSRLSNYFIITVVLCALAYFPVYAKRYDFVFFRQLCIDRAKETGQIGVYYFIRDHVPADHVFLCEEHSSLFPMMATARKMVSIGITFSNPYVNFETREQARIDMLSYLQSGTPAAAKNLFDQYRVNDILLSNSEMEKYKSLSLIPSTLIFRNAEYSVYERR